MPAGLLDTSVVIDWDDPTVAAVLPEEVAVCAITLAELAAGPHLATSSSEGARRQARLQQVEATFEPLPFDATAARSYGQIVAAVAETGRAQRSRPRRRHLTTERSPLWWRSARFAHRSDLQREDPGQDPGGPWGTL